MNSCTISEEGVLILSNSGVLQYLERLGLSTAGL